tara:strand:- start:109 stop:525 length:417 start_codon:yes stop_codon:yes gene_type:complete
MARPINNRVEKIMSSGGPETPPLDMNQFIRLADAEKFEADSLNEIIETLREKFDEQKKPGESFDSWLKRTPREDIIKISLKDGGKVIDLAQYRKSKPPKVKPISLSDIFDLNRTVSSLTPSERETLNWVLSRTFYKKD